MQPEGESVAEHVVRTALLDSPLVPPTPSVPTLSVLEVLAAHEFMALELYSLQGRQ